MVRFSNRGITCQVVYASIAGDVVVAAAYGHELTKYGLNVGLKNYSAAYCVGLLLARRVLTKFGLADTYKGQEEPDGEDYTVEPADDGPRPFYCLLDAGLKKTSTGSKTFAALKVGGGLWFQRVARLRPRLHGKHICVARPPSERAWQTCCCTAGCSLLLPPPAIRACRPAGRAGRRPGHPPQREALCGLDQGGRHGRRGAGRGTWAARQAPLTPGCAACWPFSSPRRAHQCASPPLTHTHTQTPLAHPPDPLPPPPPR